MVSSITTLRGALKAMRRLNRAGAPVFKSTDA
jgi:hypothetical protein